MMLPLVLLTLILAVSDSHRLRSTPSSTASSSSISPSDAIHYACDLSRQLITSSNEKEDHSFDDEVFMKLFDILQSNVQSLGTPLARLVTAVHQGGSSFLTARSAATTLKISHLICNDPLQLTHRKKANAEVRFAHDKTELKPATAPIQASGQDQCAQPNSDGTECTGVRTNNNKKSWCCNGECQTKNRFQAQCASICPQHANPGSDCSRSLSAGTAFCCPATTNQVEPPQCIAGNNFDTQCPDVTSTKDTSAFDSEASKKEELINEDSLTEHDETACKGIDGSDAEGTKFCSTEQQVKAAQAQHSNDDIVYEYYCCKNKCVSSSVYETFCCSTTHDKNKQDECQAKQLKARKEANFVRVLRTHDVIFDAGTDTDTDEAERDEGGEGDECDGGGEGGEGGGDDEGGDEGGENTIAKNRKAHAIPPSSSTPSLFPNPTELNPFQTHAIKHVHDGPADDSMNQVIKSGPGAMSNPSGWSISVPADHQKNDELRSHYPMVPPQFQKKKKNNCNGCGDGDGTDDQNQNMLRPITIAPRSYQEYDPFPKSNPICPVSMLTVKREDSELDGVSPRDVAQHIARFTGLWDVHVDSKIVQGQLYAPSRLPMSVSGEHFFSDIDGRSDYALMGTPGGDAGEFVLAMCALEKAREDDAHTLSKHAKEKNGGVVTGLTLPDVRSLLVEWINHIGVKKKYFFMQTDRTALSRLEEAVGVPHFLIHNYTSMDNTLKQLIINLAVLPEHVGSTHLRLMLTKAAEYGCNTKTVEYVVTAFWEILLQMNLDSVGNDDDDDSNGAPGSEFLEQISNMLLYHVNQGYHQESAVVSVYAMEGECPNSVAMVVPSATAETDARDTPVTQIIVHHPSAVAPLRAALSEFISGHEGMEGVQGSAILRHMNALGAQGLERTLEVLAFEKPRFAVFFTEKPF